MSMPLRFATSLQRRATTSMYDGNSARKRSSCSKTPSVGRLASVESSATLGRNGPTIAIRNAIAWLDARLGRCVEIVAALLLVFETVLLLAGVVALLWLLLRPAMEYVEEESFAVMPNLGVPASWRVLAIELGVILMLATALLQAARNATLRTALVAAAIVAAVGVILWLAAPSLKAIGNLNLLVFFVALIGVAIIIGVP